MVVHAAPSIVRFRSEGGQVVGAGFLVTDRQVLTCAHVITAACNLSNDLTNLQTAVVRLDFPLVDAKQPITGHVTHWTPPQAGSSQDLAVVEFEDPAPAGTRPAPLSVLENFWEHKFAAFGFPNGYSDGIWASGKLLARDANGWVQIQDINSLGYFVQPGFSGGPVWDEQVNGVVGMIVAADRQLAVRVAFMIPIDMLAMDWPELDRRLNRSTSMEARRMSEYSDLYTPYEIGVARLLARLGTEHPKYAAALSHTTRLEENIRRARDFGDTREVSAQRAEIIQQINGITLIALGVSLTDLGRST